MPIRATEFMQNGKNVNKKRFVISLILRLLMWLILPATARASVSEIRKDFLNLTSLLPASPIMAASPVDGNYLICMTTGDVANTAPTAILRWTDENGDLRNFAYPMVDGGPSGCNLIRNYADTAPTIETDGFYRGSYNLFVFGLGFWPDGNQGQGGLSEPLNYSVTGANGGHEFPFPGFPWLFAVIANNNCQWQLAAGSAGMILGTGSQVSTSYGTGTGVFTTLTSSCAYSLIALQFGPPKSGAGPLIDYEYDLLDWTDATYPKLKTVFTAGSNGADILLAINIAEQPNNGIVSEELLASWSNQTIAPCSSAVVGAPSGEPGGCVSAAFIAPLNPLQFLTYNNPGQEWGTSPSYSAEVDAIQF
ncbi:MAG: hypothetical protein ABSC33_05505 [Candidatus Sulfotelmatobacter sp.]